AVKLGGGEAADRMAVIYAAGVVAPPDWVGALRLLMLAAERGWAPARAQLEVLASMIGRDAPQAERAALSANALLEESRLRELLVPAPGRVVHDDPRICVFPKFVSERVCDWLVERARGRLERASLRCFEAGRLRRRVPNELGGRVQHNA